jgi:hypothetical protein
MTGVLKKGAFGHKNRYPQGEHQLNIKVENR